MKGEGLTTVRVSEVVLIFVVLVHDVEEGSGPAVYPRKHDLISCLAINGKWVTSQSNLQVL